MHSVRPIRSLNFFCWMIMTKITNSNEKKNKHYNNHVSSNLEKSYYLLHFLSNLLSRYCQWIIAYYQMIIWLMWNEITHLYQLTFTCSKWTIETLENVWNMFKVNNKKLGRRHWRRSGVFIVNSEHILHLFLMFLFLTLNK